MSLHHSLFPSRGAVAGSRPSRAPAAPSVRRDRKLLGGEISDQQLRAKGQWGHLGVPADAYGLSLTPPICRPQLLVDVGLVVGRCRLLGEELRLMEMWGSMKLDILELSCEDTE